MRIWLTVLGLVALIVVAGATIWWFFIASFGDRQVQEFIARAAKDGTTVTIREQERDGYPFDVRWRLRGVTVNHQSPEGNFAGEIPELVIAADAWRPQHLSYAAGQPQSWKWHPPDGQASRTYTAQTANGLFEPWQEKPGWRMVAEIQDVQWLIDGSAPAGGDAKDLFAEVFLPLNRQSADFRLRLKQMTLPEQQVFGQSVERAFALGTISPIPKDLTPAGLIAWQKADGTLSLKQSEILFGALQAGASGKVALDQAMRPSGKLQLQVSNPEAILAIATREGWVRPDQLGYAQMGLGLFSRRNASGVNELNTSLDLRGGGLWVGPVQLVKLKPLVTPR